MTWLCRFGPAALFLLCACDKGADETVLVPPSPKEARDILCWRQARTLAVEDEPEPEVDCEGVEDAFRCYGSWAAHCVAGRVESLSNCRVEDLMCAPAVCNTDDCQGGCLECVPGRARCEGPEQVLLCDGTGRHFEDAEQCDVEAGLSCSIRSGTCADLCEQAREARSYIGCEYWAVATSNSYLADIADAQGRRIGIEVEPDATPAHRMCDLFPFALVITNAEGVDATVRIENATEAPRTLTVAPDEVEVVELPCRNEADPPEHFNPASVLLGPADGGMVHSLQTRDAAYHITSDVPITVYQFNPLEYEAVAQEARVNSHTNDASLLLPVHTLTGNYTVMARATWSVEGRRTEDDSLEGESHHPGFVAITGTAESATEVTITSSAYTVASADGSVPALSPGDRLTVMLERGETLQLLSAPPERCQGDPTDTLFGIATTYCENGREYDLTGTRVRADQPVSVFGGHDCTYIPRHIAACDHLEETIFPEETLGREALVTVAEPVTCESDIPTLVRVLSTEDENEVRFRPPLYDPITLSAGESFEFEAYEDVLIEADGPILVGQYLVGQQFDTGNIRRSDDLGDPAFSLVAPLEQWRDEYTILVPKTLPNSFVNVVSWEGASITLDGQLLTRLAPFGDSGFVAARVPLEPGTHHLAAGNTFGITVYGYADYTSYLIPGGLDLTLINNVK